MRSEGIALARLRQELRERLMTERVGGVWEVLAALRKLVEQDRGQDPELLAEYRRWSMRFELLVVDSFSDSLGETLSSAA